MNKALQSTSLPPIILTSQPSEPAQSDCACPDSGFISASAIPLQQPATRWQTAPGLFRSTLPSNHEVVFNPFSASNVAVLNQAASQLLDGFAQPSLIAGTLNQPEITSALAQLAALQLIQPEGHAPPRWQSRPNTLTAWLHITNACNLRCTYCYINKTDEAMSDDTGLAAVEAVFRSAQTHGFRAVKLKYAGGESTLNFALLIKLHERAQQLAKRSNLQLHEVALSNGVALSPNMLSFMREANINLMISLDGVGETHDAQRPFRNGRGSFAHVARSIDRAIEYSLKPNLSITVTGRSANALPAAINFALDRGLGFNLNFYRDSSGDCADARTMTRTALQNEQENLIKGMRAAFSVIESRMPEQRLIDGLVDHSAFHQPHEHACGAGHNYLVIDHAGKVARCQMEIERPVSDVLAEDPLHTVRTSPHNSFTNVSVTEKEGCRDCAWRFWCSGGCPLLTFKTTGRTNIKSPYCGTYQALFPEVVRLEGLRILKWQGKTELN